MVITEDKGISIKRTFNLPLNTLRKAWTEAERVEKWWGPKNYTCSYYSRKKIVYTDGFSGNKDKLIPVSYYKTPGEWELELLITVEFEEANGKTNLLLKHEGLPEEVYEECLTGWEEYLDQLENNL